MTSSEQPPQSQPTAAQPGPAQPNPGHPTAAAFPRNPDRPPVNAGWAVVSLLFFWPLAFSAFNHAFNVYPLWADGDADGSRYASDRVKRLGQISLVIAGGLLLIFVILYAIAAIVWFAQTGDSDFHRRMR